MVRSGKENMIGLALVRLSIKNLFIASLKSSRRCVASMQDRYDYLNCRTMLEHRIGEIGRIKDLSYSES